MKSSNKSSLLALYGVIALAGSTLAIGTVAADPPQAMDDEHLDMPPEVLVDHPGIKLGKPTYEGSGCPSGTVSAVLSPDKNELSVLFAAYVAQTRPGRSFDRKTCNVAIPITVPRGLSVSIFRVDTRGFAVIPRGAEGTYRANYFFPGTTGATTQRNFSGGYNDDFILRDDVAAVAWSECGETTNARLNSSVRVSKESEWSTPEAYIAVDSQDITAEVVYYLRWRRC